MIYADLILDGLCGERIFFLPRFCETAIDCQCFCLSFTKTSLVFFSISQKCIAWWQWSNKRGLIWSAACCPTGTSPHPTPPDVTLGCDITEDWHEGCSEMSRWHCIPNVLYTPNRQMFKSPCEKFTAVPPLMEYYYQCFRVYVKLCAKHL